MQGTEREGVSQTRASYDVVAADYAENLYHELDGKPLDRLLLDQFARRVMKLGPGPVCDLGCGPGQIGRYLKDCGVADVFGADLSGGMLKQACHRNPDLGFVQSNMQALAFADQSLGGARTGWDLI